MYMKQVKSIGTGEIRVKQNQAHFGQFCQKYIYMAIKASSEFKLALNLNQNCEGYEVVLKLIESRCDLQ